MAVLATVGFVRMDGRVLTVVVVGTLPAGVLAIVAGYVVIWLLGQIPGANPDHASGSGFGVVTSGARLTQETEPGPAAWFLAAGPVVLTCCFIAAAVADALLIRVVTRWWQARQARGDQP